LLQSGWNVAGTSAYDASKLDYSNSRSQPKSIYKIVKLVDVLNDPSRAAAEV
jgi:hypothetical protein